MSNQDPIVIVPSVWLQLFRASETVLGMNRMWHALERVELQQKLLDFLDFCTQKNIDVKKIPELESLVSWSAEELNQWFKDHGFNIKFEEFDEKTFGIGVIFKLLLKWLTPGVKTTVAHCLTEEIYPAVMMENALPLYEVDGYPHPIVGIPTEVGDMVYLCLAPQKVANEFELFELVSGLKTHKRYVGQCEVTFPMIDLELSEVLDWLIGFHTYMDDGTRARVSQALRESRLSLDELGVRIDQGLAVAITLECIFEIPQIVIDGVFILWVEREGQTLPLAIAFLPETTWGDPNKK